MIIESLWMFMVLLGVSTMFLGAILSFRNTLFLVLIPIGIGILYLDLSVYDIFCMENV